MNTVSQADRAVSTARVSSPRRTAGPAGWAQALVALLVALPLLVLGGAPNANAASAQPRFLLPVPCDTYWSLTTYDYYQGIPHREAIDFNLVTASGGWLEDRGQPVLAASGGIVTTVHASSGEVKIDHGGRWVTRYLHMQGLRVAVGQVVAPSQQIGEVGNAGIYTTGPHLHFELWRDGQMIRPVFDGETVQWNRPSGDRTATHLYRSTNCLAGRGNSPAYVGKLIRHPNGTIDYVAFNGYRYWVPNMTVAGCLESPIINVTDPVFNSIPRNQQGDGGQWADCNTKYVNRLLSAPDGTVDYVDATGARSWVPSDAVVACLGGWNSVRKVDSATFNSSPRNPYGRTADCTSAYTSRLIREPGGTIDYVSAKSQRYWVPTTSVLDCLGPTSAVIEVNTATFNTVPRNPQNTTASCATELVNRMIRRNDGTVDYVTSTGQRYWVPNGTIVNCLGGWHSVLYVTDDRFTSLPRNPANTWATCATKNQ